MQIHWVRLKQWIVNYLNIFKYMYHTFGHIRFFPTKQIFKMTCSYSWLFLDFFCFVFRVSNWAARHDQASEISGSHLLPWLCWNSFCHRFISIKPFVSLLWLSCNAILKLQSKRGSGSLELIRNFRTFFLSCNHLYLVIRASGGRIMQLCCVEGTGEQERREMHEIAAEY